MKVREEWILLRSEDLKQSFKAMVKVITKIGDSQGLIMDQALLDLAHLKVGDQVNIEVHDGGTVTITPLRPRINPRTVEDVVAKVVKDYASTLNRLM